MLNPWLNLPETEPYVLSEDEAAIAKFNSRLHNDDERRIDLRLIPEPFIGYQEAPVVILMHNPGRAPGDWAMFSKPSIARASRESITTPGGTPMYTLSPDMAPTPAGIYYRDALKSFHNSSRSWQDLAKKVIFIEQHGYHSTRSSPIPRGLPSQEFGFALVRQAMKQRRIIVIGLAASKWYTAVPGLDEYSRTVTKNSPQTRALSRRNLGEAGFNMISRALNG